jgi:hypothetical protein
MTGPPIPVPIDPYFRDESPPDDATVVVRAGPLTVEKFVEHMRREQERYTYRGQPLSSVSVDATVAGWTLEAILRDRLWSRPGYASVTAGALRATGHELLPTFDAPHFDLVLPAATVAAAGTLLSLFGPAERNSCRRRR